MSPLHYAESLAYLTLAVTLGLALGLLLVVVLGPLAFRMALDVLAIVEGGEEEAP